jgi:hypothetical protein
MAMGSTLPPLAVCPLHLHRSLKKRVRCTSGPYSFLKGTLEVVPWPPLQAEQDDRCRTSPSSISFARDVNPQGELALHRALICGHSWSQSELFPAVPDVHKHRHQHRRREATHPRSVFADQLAQGVPGRREIEQWTIWHAYTSQCTRPAVAWPAQKKKQK